MTNHRLRPSHFALALALSGALLAFSASAAPEPSTPAAEMVAVSDAAYPKSASVAGETLELNGAGLRKILFIEVYAAALYVPSPASDPAQIMAEEGPRRVALTLMRDVSGEDFIEALEEGLNDNLTPEKKAAIEKDIESLKAIMTAIGDVKKGDAVDFDYAPDTGTTVRRNGELVGSPIAGKALYDAVLAIWLGDKPIDGGLKKSLLGPVR